MQENKNVNDVEHLPENLTTEAIANFITNVANTLSKFSELTYRQIITIPLPEIRALVNLTDTQVMKLNADCQLIKEKIKPDISNDSLYTKFYEIESDLIMLKSVNDSIKMLDQQKETFEGEILK